MFWLLDSIFLCALKSYAKLVQGERKSKLVCDFSEPPPNFGLSKVKQTSAECKTKNEVFGFAYAECSQTYVKLVQGVYARNNDTLSDKKRKPPIIAPDDFR